MQVRYLSRCHLSFVEICFRRHENGAITTRVFFLNSPCTSNTYFQFFSSGFFSPEWLLGFLQELLLIFLMEFFCDFFQSSSRLVGSVVVYRISCSDSSKIFSADFLGISFILRAKSKALPGIPTKKYTKMLDASFRIVAPGVLAGFFFEMSPRITKEIL